MEHEPFLKLDLKVHTKEDTNSDLLMWEEVRTVGKHPSRRSYHSAVMWGDKMIVYGGQDISEGPQGGLWSIEIGQFSHDSWEMLNVENKGSFSRHTAVLKNNLMYIFGGTNGAEEFNRTLTMNLATLKWTEHHPTSNIPPPLDSHTACLYETNENAYMVVFGGFAKGERTNQLYLMSLQDYSWSNPQTSDKRPEIRSSHSAVIYKNDLYVFGGISDEGEKLKDLWKLNLKDYTWEEIIGDGDIPTGRSGHSSIVYKDVMVIFGGMKDITKETNDMYSYNFSLNYWTLFQYEYQVKDPVSPDQLEEFKKSKAIMGASMKSKSPNNDSSIRTSPARKPISNETSKAASPVRRGTAEGDGLPYRRRKTLYEGPLNPTEGRIRGKLPHPRDGHSAVLSGDIMIVFGGDRHQMPFNDTYVYYLVEEKIKTPVSAI
jgi:Galactose oxidase, central domain